MNATGLETKCALVTDGKISGFAKGPFICQVSPGAVVEVWRNELIK
jgi:dihydroxyacid dehydratase/phosphogluconate dehydratase